MRPEIERYIQEYVDKMQAKGITPTLQQINEHLAGFMHDVNNRPKENFEGYSSREMSKILDYTFDSDSPVQFKTLTSEEYTQMPLFRQVKCLLQTVVEHEVKLTTAGYMPPRIVKELYPLGIGETLIDEGLAKLSKESDSNSVVLARNICEIAGLVKVRKGVLSVTANGTKVANNDPKLFKQVFKTFCQKFNWGHFDGYPNEQIGRFGFGFSFILLKKFGNIKREDDFYCTKYFKALPTLIDGTIPTYGTVEEYCYNCYSIRTFDRFLLHFSLIEISKEGEFNSPRYIAKTALFDKLIEVFPHRKLNIL